MERKKIVNQENIKLIIASILVSILSAGLGLLLKHLTEYFEHTIFLLVENFNPKFFLIIPSIGLTIIYFLRKYFFKNRKNKGITEIFDTLDHRKKHLPLFKIPSHFINGFLTIVFGGSTGIEVSTVVATAAIGNATYEKGFSAKKYKKELVCAGVTAGVAVLFVSPLAGWLFAIEVIAKKRTKSLFISCSASALVAWFLVFIFKEPKLFNFNITNWNYYAIPFFIILSFLGSLLSIYFTLLVTRIKNLFSKISYDIFRVNAGALFVGLMILFFPILYGDSYHGLKEIIQESNNNQNISLLLLIVLVVLKPMVASITLGAGGDGGVFAPSIVAGALLGLMLANFLNTHFNTNLIPLNFALVGAGATLSASLYAPFTSVFLISALFPGGNILFFPILFSCILAQMFSKKILPYNVYTYEMYLKTRT